MFKFCDSSFTTVNIHPDGSVAACLCSGWHKYNHTKMGNLNQNTLKEIFANQQFNEFRGSILDQSFKFCRKDECAKMWSLDELESLDNIQRPILPTKMNVQIEKNCNLKCGSCRNSLIWSKEVNPQVEKILNTLIEDYQDFDLPVWFQCDGLGDVFASSAYQNFFKSDRLPKCFQFNITSNGNLITKNLDILEKIKSQIFSVCVSFDSANADTYKEVRGGKYSLIVDGVKAMIDMGISRVNTSFVVQKKNYLEILDQYYWCKENGINYGGFSKIDRWGHMSNEWWQENQIDNNPTVDYKFLVNALNIIKKDNQRFGLCGGLENLIATKSTSISN